MIGPAAVLLSPILRRSVHLSQHIPTPLPAAGFTIFPQFVNSIKYPIFADLLIKHIYVGNTTNSG